MDCISEDVVVLIQRDTTCRPFRLKRGRKVHFEKVSFFPDGALGNSYGSCFRVEKKQLVLMDESSRDSLTWQDIGDVSAADNRMVHDDGTAQELTDKDIKDMKGQGISGQGIVSSMIEHSTSFKDKTKFSQEKYIKKKKKKYIPIFRITRTTTALLCELYFTQTPTKTYYLRKDTLAQILTMSNVHANTDMVLVETCQGFMAGAMLERMGGLGHLVQIFYGDYPVRIILSNFGHLSEADLSILMSYPLQRVGSLLTQQELECVTLISERLVQTGDKKMPPTQQDLRKVSAISDLPERSHKRLEMQESEGMSPLHKKPRLEQFGGGGDDEAVNGGSSAVEDSSTSEQVMDKSSRDGEESLVGEDVAVGGGEEAMSVMARDGEDKEEEVKDVVGSGGEEKEGGGCGGGSDLVGTMGSVFVAEDSVLLEDGAGGTFQAQDMTEGDRKRGRKTTLTEEKAMKRSKRLEREEAYKASEKLLSQRKMDGLVIVCRHHPEPIVMSLVNFLAPSRPIIVYCHLLEPLIQCYKSLKESEMVFNLQLSETWMRRYQVLQERTHPEMMMDGQSGYILTGLRVRK